MGTALFPLVGTNIGTVFGAAIGFNFGGINSVLLSPIVAAGGNRPALVRASAGLASLALLAGHAATRRETALITGGLSWLAAGLAGIALTHSGAAFVIYGPIFGAIGAIAGPLAAFGEFRRPA